MLQHPAFQAAPQRGQFAQGGEWESAWSFDRAAPPSATALADYLRGSTEVAFEAFFGHAFFGARVTGDAATVAAFAEGCGTALQGARDGADFFARLGDATGFRCLGGAIAFCEVGAVNAWRSVGAVGTSAPASDPAAFDAQLDTLWHSLMASALARDTTHRKALELAATHPLPHWFALPMSGDAPPFALDRTRLRDALAWAAQLGAASPP